MIDAKQCSDRTLSLTLTLILAQTLALLITQQVINAQQCRGQSDMRLRAANVVAEEALSELRATLEASRARTQVG